ncbi:MAG: hypothetical protein K6G50_06080 [bacterium]|nr:hypothetical protein [bacterium]
MLNNPSNNSSVDNSRVSDAELEEIVNYGKEHGEPFIWDDQDFNNCTAYMHLHHITPESPPSEMKDKILLMAFCTTRRQFFQDVVPGIQKRIESMWCESIASLIVGIACVGMALMYHFL